MLICIELRSCFFPLYRRGRTFRVVRCTEHLDWTWTWTDPPPLCSVQRSRWCMQSVAEPHRRRSSQPKGFCQVRNHSVAPCNLEWPSTSDPVVGGSPEPKRSDRCGHPEPTLPTPESRSTRDPWASRCVLAFESLRLQNDGSKNLEEEEEEEEEEEVKVRNGRYVLAFASLIVQNDGSRKKT